MKKGFLLLAFWLLGHHLITAQKVFIDSVAYQDGYRTIRVFLPKDYEHKTTPLLYMLDGQNLFDEKTSYAGEWMIDEIISSFPLSKQAVVIGIDHGNDKRMDELTPFTNEKYGGGDGALFLEWIMNTVKPYVYHKYSLKPNQDEIGIAGSSLGGLFAHYAAIKHPEYFTTAGVFSPSFWWSGDAYELAFDYVETNATPQHFIFQCGDSESDDMVPDMKRMHDIMLSKNNTVTYSVLEGANHSEKTWQALFPAFYASWLQFY